MISSDLCTAIANRQFSDKKVTALIYKWLKQANGENINDVDSEGNTLAHLLAAHGRLKGLLEFINNGYNPTFSKNILPTAHVNTNQQGQTLLHVAAMCGHAEVVAYLFKTFPHQIFAQTATADTPLSLAIRNKHTEVAAILIEQMTPEMLELTNNENMTALLLAIHVRQKNIVNQLLQTGADINARNNQGENAFLLALRSGLTNIAMTLHKQHGANISETNNQGDTALLISLETEQLEMVKYLLKWGASLLESNAQGRCVQSYKTENTANTANTVKNDIAEYLQNYESMLGKRLLYAAKHGAHKDVENFLRRGAPIECVDQNGRNAMMLALIHNQQEVVNYLFTLPINFSEQCDREGNNLFLLACHFNDPKRLQMLLDRNVSARQVNQQNENSLMISARCGHAANVEFILAREVIDINAENREGLTPLSIAIVAGQGKIVALLSQKNAQLGKAHDESNPLSLAVDHDHAHLLPLFKKLYPEAIYNSFVNDAFITALKKRQLRCLQIFSKEDIDVKAVVDPRALAELVVEDASDIVVFLCACGVSLPANDNACYRAEETESLKCLLNYRTQLVNDFIEAATENDLPTLQPLLKMNVCINDKNTNDETALYCATRAGNSESVRFLLENGARLLEPNNPLQEAVKGGREEILQLFVVHQKRLTAESPDCFREALIASLLAEQFSLSSFLYQQMSEYFINDTSFIEDFLTPILFDGHSKAVEWCLSETEIAARCDLAKAPLHIALRNQHIVIVKKIIGLEQVSLGAKGFEYLLMAIKQENIETMQLLIDKQPDLLTQTDPDGNTALMLAIQENKIKAAVWLLKLKQKIDVSRRNNAGENDLFFFARSQIKEVFFQALEQYVRNHLSLPEQKEFFWGHDTKGNTVFLTALKAHHFELAQYFLNLNYLPLSDINQAGEAALSLACNDKDIADFLFGNLNVIKKTCLKHIAEKNFQALKKIIDAGFPANHVLNKQNETLLTLAVKNNHLETVRFLIEECGVVDNTPSSVINSADNDRDEQFPWNECLAVHHVILNDNREMLVFILEKGAKWEINNTPYLEFLRSLFGASLLHAAILVDSQAILQYLITEKNFDVNAIGDSSTCSALNYAIHKNNFPMVKTLMENGASVEIPDESGNTAIMLALQKQNLRMVDYILKERSCDLNIINHNGHSVLFLAAIHCPDRCVEIMRQGADPLLSLPERCMPQTYSKVNNVLLFVIIRNNRNLIKEIVNHVGVARVRAEQSNLIFRSQIIKCMDVETLSLVLNLKLHQSFNQVHTAFKQFSRSGYSSKDNHYVRQRKREIIEGCRASTKKLTNILSRVLLLRLPHSKHRLGTKNKTRESNQYRPHKRNEQDYKRACRYIEFGADVNTIVNVISTPDRTGRRSFLEYMCDSNDLSFVELLLKKGAQPNVKRHRGEFVNEFPTLIYYAITLRNEALVNLFLDNGAEVHLRGETGISIYSCFVLDFCPRLERELGAQLTQLPENQAYPLTAICPFSQRVMGEDAIVLSDGTHCSQQAYDEWVKQHGKRSPKPGVDSNNRLVRPDCTLYGRNRNAKEAYHTIQIIRPLLSKLQVMLNESQISKSNLHIQMEELTAQNNHFYQTNFKHLLAKVPEKIRDNSLFIPLFIELQLYLLQQKIVRRVAQRTVSETLPNILHNQETLYEEACRQRKLEETEAQRYLEELLSQEKWDELKNLQMRMKENQGEWDQTSAKYLQEISRLKEQKEQADNEEKSTEALKNLYFHLKVLRNELIKVIFSHDNANPFSQMNQLDYCDLIRRYAVPADSELVLEKNELLAFPEPDKFALDSLQSPYFCCVTSEAMTGEENSDVLTPVLIYDGAGHTAYTLSLEVVHRLLNDPNASGTINHGFIRIKNPEINNYVRTKIIPNAPLIGLRPIYEKLGNEYHALHNAVSKEFIDVSLQTSILNFLQTLAEENASQEETFLELLQQFPFAVTDLTKLVYLKIIVAAHLDCYQTSLQSIQDELSNIKEQYQETIIPLKEMIKEHSVNNEWDKSIKLTEEIQKHEIEFDIRKNKISQQQESIVSDFISSIRNSLVEIFELQNSAGQSLDRQSLQEQPTRLVEELLRIIDQTVLNSIEMTPQVAKNEEMEVPENTSQFECSGQETNPELMHIFGLFMQASDNENNNNNGEEFETAPGKSACSVA